MREPQSPPYAVEVFGSSGDSPMTTPRIHLDGRKWASLALIPFALILIVLFTVLDIRIATEPPFLLTILNTVFIGIIPLVIAAIALRSYRSSGSASLFMMGSG